MKFAADFRAIARDALRGKWLTAVLTGFVASLLGAELFTNSVSFSNFKSSADNFKGHFYELQHAAFWPFVRTVLGIVAAVLIIRAVVLLFIRGAATLGYAEFNLNLVDGKQARFSDLFSQFDRLGVGFGLVFFTTLYTLLWSMLFVIPGIVKSYSYAMAPYILSENPNMSANEAITESRRIMPGNRWRLFCLEISFIGWGLLCLLPPLIPLCIGGAIYAISGSMIPLLLLIPLMIPLSAGNLFLRPYREAARAAFYRDIAMPKVTNTPPPPEDDNGFRRYTEYR